MKGSDNNNRLFYGSQPEASFAIPSDPSILRVRQARVEVGLITSEETITLNLFEDVTLIAHRQPTDHPPAQAIIWFGRIEGDDQSEVTFATVGDVTAGNIRTRGLFYEVRFAGNGWHWIYQIDPLAFPDELPPLIPDGSLISPEIEHRPTINASPLIDVMVVYTPEALAGAGGDEAIQAEINLAVSETNTGYANSEVIPRIRLAHTAEISYTETAFDWPTTLQQITDPDDGVMDEVHPQKYQHAADVVVLLVNEKHENICGISWVMTTPTHNGNHAFSVVARPCATGYYTFAHEIGHNMGCYHDRANTGGMTGVFPYSYGYQAPDKAFRTIMAYNCPVNCPRINYWSNPDVLYNGQPTGKPESDPEAADNHQSINVIYPIVAGWQVDTIPPSMTFDIPGISQWYTSDQIIQWSAYDIASGIDYFLWDWDNPQPGTRLETDTYSTTLSAAGQGAHTLYVQAWDVAGNHSAIVSRGWFGYDLVSPTIMFVTPPPGQWFSIDQSIRWLAVDYNSGVDHILWDWDNPQPDEILAGDSFSTTVSAAGEGAHTLYVQARDVAGNASNIENRGWFGYDSVAPLLPLITPNCAIVSKEWQNTCRSVSFFWNSLDPGDQNASGIADYAFAWGTDSGAVPTEWVSMTLFTPSLLPIIDGWGQYYLNVRSRDLAGNVSPISSFGLWYDGSQPIAQMVVNGGTILVQSESVTITIEANDTGSGLAFVYLSNDSVTWLKSVYSPTVQWQLAGRDQDWNTIYLRIEDKAGNVSNRYSLDVCLDTTATTPMPCRRTIFLPLISFDQQRKG